MEPQIRRWPNGLRLEISGKGSRNFPNGAYQLGKRDVCRVCFIVAGKIAVEVVGTDLMVYPGPGNYEAALALLRTRPMDFTGRGVKGFVYVGSDGLETDTALTAWVERSAAFARSLHSS